MAEYRGKTIYHFEVLQEHIDKGKIEDEESCPIALAIKDAGHVAKVSDEIIVDGKRFSVPQAASDFIGDFDGGFEPSPFSFDLTEEDLIDPEFLIEEDDASL